MLAGEPSQVGKRALLGDLAPLSVEDFLVPTCHLLKLRGKSINMSSSDRFRLKPTGENKIKNILKQMEATHLWLDEWNWGTLLDFGRGFFEISQQKGRPIVPMATGCLGQKIGDSQDLGSALWGFKRGATGTS